MRGMLFSQMAPPEGCSDDEFERWYDEEHIPARLALPGFVQASRYRAIEGEPWHLAVYDLGDLAVLDTPEYQRLKAQPSERTARMLAGARSFTRYICEQVSDSGAIDEQPQCLFVATFDVPASAVAEFDAWYEEEHVPILLEADGWLRVRRYRSRPGHEGPPWSHFALHELRDPAVLDAPERARARSTAWRERLAREPWFSSTGRWIYERIAVAAPR